MPASPPDSTDSSPPSRTPSAEARAIARPIAWRTNLWLFLATVVSVLVTGAAGSTAPFFSRQAFAEAGQFTGALLAILLAHEFGHFIAARVHKVDATLPFFIPMPLLSPFGTMGAVIRMRSVIPTRNALLDIGASGPLAGLALAIPMYCWGVAHSTLVAAGAPNSMQLGESILLRVIEKYFGPEIPPGMDVNLSPVAFAAWAGMFVTMINLLPAGQLDAGHVAYALFGPRQNKIAQFVHRGVLAFFFVSLGSFLLRDVRAGLGFTRIGVHVTNALFWLVWFEVLAVLGTLSRPRPAAAISLGEEDAPRPLTNTTRIVGTLGLALLAGVMRDAASPLLWIAWFVSLGVLLAMEIRWGTFRDPHLLDHPPTGREPLGKRRAAIAVLTLAFSILLFMPTPISL